MGAYTAIMVTSFLGQPLPDRWKKPCQSSLQEQVRCTNVSTKINILMYVQSQTVSQSQWRLLISCLLVGLHETLALLTSQLRPDANHKEDMVFLKDVFSERSLSYLMKVWGLHWICLLYSASYVINYSQHALFTLYLIFKGMTATMCKKPVFSSSVYSTCALYVSFLDPWEVASIWKAEPHPSSPQCLHSGRGCKCCSLSYHITSGKINGLLQ